MGLLDVTSLSSKGLDFLLSLAIYTEKLNSYNFLLVDGLPVYIIQTISVLPDGGTDVAGSNILKYKIWLGGPGNIA